MRLLVVEDEKRIADFLCRGLQGAGYAVDAASNGVTALEFVHATDYDLVILDIMLPDMDGLQVLEKVRNRKAGPPVLILSARGALEDRVRGLEQGADDYLVKPFAFVELLARVRALLRRGQPAPERLQVADLTLDCIRRKVMRAAEPIDLAPKEFGILEYMMRNKGRPLSRTMIVEHVWDMDYDGLTNIVDVYIRHLRSKIDDRFAQKLIQTVRGIGYMIEAPDKAAEKPAEQPASGRRSVSAERHLTRGLRFRLTAGYALLFALLLVGTAALFRERLAYTLNSEANDLLEQEWVAVKGYLHIERVPTRGRAAEHEPCGPYKAKWEYDKNDPDEDFAVERLRRVYVLADAKGCVMQFSTIYESIGIEQPKEIEAAIKSGQPVWKRRPSPHGVPYLIRAGVIFEDNPHTPFYVAVGRPMDENDKILQRYTWMYAGLIPLSLLCGCLLGWFLTGRALMPVMHVAQTAQSITGSNLSLRIPTRGAGDELDYLILTFNRMIERLESSFQQIRQFSTDVSHELRTPITAIRGQLEVALFTAKTVDQYRDATLNSLQDIERLSQIVRALLLLSQAESGQLALQKTRLDLSAVVRDIVDQFQIPAEGARIELSADLPPECAAEVDRVQIERMLSNLLSNALKFTPAGGRVHVALRSLPESIVIEVEDTGCGIPEEHIPHIFERFYRVPAQETCANPEPGLGLGLSFVAWIAKAHGGTIRVDSAPAKGTRFTVSLPAAVAEPAPLEAVPAGAAVGPHFDE